MESITAIKGKLDLQEVRGALGGTTELYDLLAELQGFMHASTGHAHTAAADDAPNIAASSATVADAGSLITATEVEAALQEIFQHVQSAQAFIPVPLHSVRETSTMDVGAIAANGGVLASDTTPIMEAINGATDGCQRISWVANDVDEVTFQVPLPPDIDVSADVVVHLRIASAGTTNAVGFTLASYFNEGDTAVADTSGTNQTATYAEVVATIAAADVPAGAQTLTVGLTPVAHATDALYLTAIWIEYTRTVLTS
jgi:hypothetical protein